MHGTMTTVKRNYLISCNKGCPDNILNETNVCERVCILLLPPCARAHADSDFICVCSVCALCLMTNFRHEK